MSIRTYPQFPQTKYIASNSTQASFTLTAGRKAVAVTDGVMHLSGNTSHALVPLNGARGAAFQFFGTRTSVDNETFDARIWAGTFAMISSQTSPIVGPEKTQFIDLNYIGEATVTLSTATGVSASDLVPATSYIGDTIVWEVGADSTTPDGIQSTLETAYGLGASAAYSPAANVPASLIVPNFGPLCHAFLIEFDLTGAASANALYTLTP